jgi:hypothetical protein
MLTGIGNAIVLGGTVARGGTGLSVSNSTTMIMDADGEMLGIKIYPETNQHVSHVDMSVNFIGDHTAIHYQLGIYLDTTDIPDTGTPTLMGGLTAEVHGISGGAGTGAWLGGGTDPIELSTHADLVANTPYWLVLRIGASGGGLSGSVTVGLRGIASYYPTRLRIHNGTSWTAVAASAAQPNGYVIKVGTTYYGLPYATSVGSSAQTHIYSTNKQGISFKVGCKMYCRGVILSVATDPTPGELIVTCYGATTVHVHIPYASIVSTIAFFVFFDAPVELTPDAMTYIILSSPDSADNSNDYTLRTMAINANYISACSDDNFRMVVGTEEPPTTAVTTEYPCMWPIVCDMVADLDQAAAGGGAINLDKMGAL